MVIKRLGLGYMMFGALLIWAGGVLEREAAAARLQRRCRCPGCDEMSCGQPGCDECPADQLQRDPVPAED